jgi:hypothetical protein
MSRWILRAAGGPVDLDRQSLGVDARVDQVKRDVRAGLGEEARALAEDHGDDEELDLVDEVVVEQPPDQGTAAVDLHLTPRLGFQLADGRREVTGEDGDRTTAPDSSVHRARTDAYAMDRRPDSG